MEKARNEKYERILKAAIDVISEKGMEKASISDIVKKADVAQGTFYLYFRSKNALIPAIAENLLTYSFGKIKKRSHGKDDFWDILLVMIDQTFQTTKQYKDVIVLCYAGLAFEYSMETWETIYTPYYRWFEGILAKAAETKQIIPVNVKWHATMMINLMENEAERFYIANDTGSTLEGAKLELFHFFKRSLALRI
ncbi:TetR family transcriptional regulator [Heyndrickxia acidiproducens]|uniref:TetR family transcriptional regulator n=1 Tax=Heyndrickxia acidiproducens TaxID=1121084 RepID=UPI000367ECC6|nr:TetR family transcriptional regulator [Heyndrickxia acidiproducens]